MPPAPPSTSGIPLEVPSVMSFLSLEYIPFLAGSAILLILLNTYIDYHRAVNSVQHHPGIRSLLSAASDLANALPYIPGVAIGYGWGMRLKHSLYVKSGWDIISYVGLYPRPAVGFMIADPLAIKEITLNRARFPKPLELYEALSFYGKNIVITEGDEWKKHRKITAPVFSERNNKLVWDESIRVMLEMFQSWGTDKPEVVVDHAGDISVAIALLVICIAGFGRRISWKADEHIPPGHKLTFKDAIETASTAVLAKVLAPKWAYPFSKYLRHIRVAYEELGVYMREMVEERLSSSVKEERYDLFSALLDGSDGDAKNIELTIEEVIGNIYIFLVAGHETTAHTVCFCMGLLALEPEEQDKLYQHITSVLPNNEIPTYEQMSSFTYSLAVFYETLRLYPPVPYIPKKSAEDTTIPVVRPDGTKGTLSVPKGAGLNLNTTGLHFNPRYWPDPEAFKPSRFFGDWPKDAFLPFAGGARACLGRRFAETEAVAILTILVSRYKIELKNPELYESLSHEEKRAKLLANRPGVTTTPLHVPLIFKRR